MFVCPKTGEDLDAANNFGLHVSREIARILQNTVHSVPHPESLHDRVEVDIRSAESMGVRYEAFDQPDDRVGGAAGQFLIYFA